MRKSDALLVILVILFLGFVIWIFYTGKFNSLVAPMIDQAWNSIQGMLGPIFRR